MTLNKTQENIVALVVKGKTNQQIADELCFSVDNIKKDLKAIYKHYKINAPAETKRAVLVREVVKIEMSKLMI